MTAIQPENAQAEIPPVAKNLFGYGAGGLPYLIGGHCPTCARHYFPLPEYCVQCQGAVEEADLGNEGVVYSHTTIRTKPPYGLPRPYAVAMIDLAPVPLRIFCLLDPHRLGAFEIGQNVVLNIGQIGHDGAGKPCLRPYFTLPQA
jgi:uncharacterized OB-fold protein